MPLTGISAANLDPVASLVAALNAASTVNTFPVAAPTGVAATDYANIAAQATAASAAGGGRVVLRAGTYKTNTALPWLSNVWYQGAGIDATVIRPQANHGFSGNGTSGSPIANAVMSDLTLDGADIATSVTYKGHYSAYLKDCRWVNVKCQNFTATGFGSDFLVGCVYAYCVATSNGRGQSVDAAGMSGFGIGTSAYTVEDTLLIGCKATSNTNFGIFFEYQGIVAGRYSMGPKVIGCHVEGNNWGIGDAGCDGIVIEGCTAKGNTAYGIGVSDGSHDLGRPGRKYVIRNNYCTGNGTHGIHLDYSENSLTATTAYGSVAENLIDANTGSGIRIDAAPWASDKLRGVAIRNNTIRNNGASGIYVTTTTSGGDGGGDIYDMDIANNKLLANGQSDSTIKHGIQIAGNTTRLSIKRNQVADDGGTKKQAYGLYMDAAYTHTDAEVVGNGLRNNLTGAASFNGTWAGTSRVLDNPGYNPVGISSVSLGSSPATYTAGVTREDVYITGGTVSAVKVTPAGGSQSTLHLTTNVTVPLEPGDAVEVTYSGLPTSTKTYKH